MEKQISDFIGLCKTCVGTLCNEGESSKIVRSEIFKIIGIL